MALKLNGATGLSGIDGTSTIPALQGTDSNTGIIFPAADTIAFVEGGSEAMRIDSSGRVGIGDTAPDAKLVVRDSGDCSITVKKTAQNVTGIGSENALGFLASDSALSIRVGGQTSSSERARIDSSGRLLVGTASARTDFFNSASSYVPRFQLEGSDGIGTAMLSVLNNDSGGNPAYIILGLQKSGSSGGDTVVANGNEVGEISFQGNDGSEMVAAASIKCAIDGTPGANDMPGRLVFSTTADGASSPTERMRISANGNINLTGIMTIEKSTAIWGYNAPRSGAGSSTLKWNTGTAEITYDTSSRLVKQNIEDLGYGIETIKQLQPRRYYRIDDRKDEIGFIADEIISVIPEVVPIGPKSRITRNDDDTEEIPIAVNYDKLTAVLVKALQEAVARIETLEAEVAALKAS